MAIWLLARPQDCIEENIYWQKLLTRTSTWSSSKEDWKSNFRVTDYHNITSITTSPLSQHHHYHNITTITTSPLSQYPLYHHYHNVTTISPLSQYHRYHNITTISPLTQYHHYHKITARSPLSQYHHYITAITISPPSHVSGEGFIFTSSTFTLSERCLARKLRFHIFNFQIVKDVPHESFVFTSSTITCGEMSRTKASFSHLPLSDFEGCPARKLRFHIVYYHLWRDVSHESFVFTSSTFRFWRMSRTKASFSHRLLSLVERCLARNLRYHIFHFHFWKDVSHESFVFASSASRFWGKSPLRVFLLCFATQSLQIAL